MLLFTSYLLSIILATFTQPLTMGLTLMIQTIITSLIIYNYTNLSWYAYISVIVIVGGLLVSFIYVAVLIPNEPTARRSLWSLPIIIVPSIIFINNASNLFINTPPSNCFPIILFSSSIALTIILIAFLLLALIIVVHNTANNNTPMRAY